MSSPSGSIWNPYRTLVIIGTEKKKSIPCITHHRFLTESRVIPYLGDVIALRLLRILSKIYREFAFNASFTSLMFLALDAGSRFDMTKVLWTGKLQKQSNLSQLFVLQKMYIAAYDASKEAVWIRKFIYGLGVDNIMCQEDSYLREVIELGDVKIEKVHTYDNLADPFTKALPLAKHSEHTQNIGMLPASSLM
ncbi:hypothetical protein Tco_0018031 [Tanacetum coccineum]